MDKAARWVFDLTHVTMNAASRRTAFLPPEQAWRLYGTDMSQPGGLRPSPGFKLLHDLELAENEVISDGDFFVFTAPVTAEKAFAGYIYRVHNTSNNLRRIVVRYWYDDDTGGPGLSENTRTVFSPSSSLTGAMSFAVFGRLVYVFVKGREPRCFYLTPEVGSTAAQFELITDTGPGPSPSLKKVGLITTSGPPLLDNTAGSTFQKPLGQISVGIGISTAGDNYPAFTTPGGDAVETDESQPYKFKPGNYSFAYRLVDSKTGRQSALSNVVSITERDFEGAVETSSTGTSIDSTALAYLLFQVLVPDEYDTVYLYRSTYNIPNSEVGPLQVQLWLEKILTEDDNEATFNQGGAASGFRRFWHYFGLSDQSIMLQDTLLDRVIVDEDMPFAGAAINVDSILFLSDIESETGSNNESGVGEIRFSSSLVPTPETFPPNNRIVPPAYQDRPITFIRAGGNVLGMSPTRIHWIRTAAGIVEVEPVHNGYGIASRRAGCSVSELVLFLTSTGVKMVDSTGRLDAVTAFDNVVRDDWAGQLSNTFMVYDPTFKTVFIADPTVGEACVVWLETSSASMYRDWTFVAGFAGPDPQDTDDTREEFAQFITATGRIYRYDGFREKALTSTMLDLTTAGLFDITGSVTGGSSGPWTVTLAGSPSLDAHLVDGWVYQTTGAGRGNRWRVTAVSGSTLTLYGLTAPVTGTTLALSPMFVRWVSGAVGLSSADGYEFGPADIFRVRHLSDMGVFMGAVEGANNVASETYDATVWRNTDEEPATVATPTNTADVQVATIVNGEPRYWAAWGEGDIRTGIDGTFLSVGIDIYVPGVDFTIPGVMIRGTIRKADYAGDLTDGD